MDAELYLALLDRQAWDLQRSLDDQLRRLSRLVSFAARNIAHYRKAFGDAQITSLSDLRRLPVLTREICQEAGPSLVADGVSAKGLGRAQTGGSTTGQPLTVYRDPAATERERAHIFAAWRRFGVMPGERIAVVVGRAVAPDGATHRLAEPTQTLWLGGDQFPPERITEIARHLREFRPVMVRGYSSTLSLLANHVVDHGIELPDSIIAVGSSSETLHPWEAEAITSAFNVPIANLYGQTEQVALAVSCLGSASLHVDPAYGVLEIIDDGGRHISEPGVVGEVIATGLGNPIAPLIRYATGDRAAWDTPECACGIRSPRLSVVDGRTADVVLDVHGVEHVFSSILYGPLFQVDTPVRKVQFRQDEPGLLNVVVRPKRGVDPRILEEWVRVTLSYIEDFAVQVSADDEFLTTASGKQLLFARPRS